MLTILRYWKVGVLALILGGLGWLIYSWNWRGKRIGTLELQLADSTKLLGIERKHRFALQVDSTVLQGKFLVADNARLQAQRVVDEAASLTRDYAISISQANHKVDQTVQAMNALRRKQAADRLVGGVGTITSSINDSVLNGEVAQVKGRLQVYEDSLPKLVNTASTLRAKNSQLQNENSDLERTLNGAVASSIYAEQSWVDEAQTRRFLGAGRRKNARQQAAAVRNKRDKPH